MEPPVNPFARAQAHLVEAIQKRVTLPPKPDWKENLKKEGWDKFYADLNYLSDPPSIIFMRSPTPLQGTGFADWLVKLKKFKEPLEVTFDQGALAAFSSKILEIWMDAKPNISSICFKNSLVEERQAIISILRGSSHCLVKLDLHNCEQLEWEVLKGIPGVCINLQEANLSNNKRVTVEIIHHFLQMIGTLNKLVLNYLEINGTVFQELSTRANLFEELDLSYSTITDQALCESTEYAPPKLTQLKLADCEKISGIGVIPFLRSWSSIQTLDLSGVPNLSQEDVGTILAIPHLRHLLLNRVKAVNDAVFASVEMRESGLFRLSVQDSAVTPKGLNRLLAQGSRLEVIDVSYCPGFESTPLVEIQRQYPSVQILSNKLPKPGENPLHLGIKGFLSDQFKLYLTCLFPNSEVSFDETNNQWNLTLIAERDTRPILWGAELNQMIGYLGKAKMKVVLRSHVTINPTSAPAFCTFVQALSPIITELVSKGNYPLSFLPKLRSLELEGWVINRTIVEGLKTPVLRTLTLKDVLFAEDASAILTQSNQQLEEWTIIRGTVPLYWESVNSLASLPNVSKRAFPLPVSVPPESGYGYDLCFALWQNHTESEKSRKLAAALLEKIPLHFDLSLFCRSLRAQFAPLIAKLIAIWNETKGGILALTYENEKLKGKISLPLPKEIQLNYEMQTMIVRLAASVPLDWLVETAPNTPLMLPPELKGLAQAISPHISSFTWKHELKDEKNPLPVPTCAPFLKQAAGLKHLIFAHVSLTTVALKEVFASPGLKSLTFVCCQGISAQEIRSWSLWGNTLENLTFRDCQFIVGNQLETALAETFTKLQILHLEGSKAVTNSWIHALSNSCTTLEGLNLKNTAIDDECFKSELFKFSALHTLNIASTAVTDEGLVFLSATDRHLKGLDISDCYICGAGFMRFGLKIPLLEKVAWKDCPVATPSGIAFLATGAPYLRSLDVSRSKLHSLEGVKKAFEMCHQLTQVIVETDEIPKHLAEALRKPFQSSHLNIEERHLKDDQLLLWRKTVNSLTKLNLKGCSYITEEGFSEFLVQSDLEEVDLFIKLPGNQVLNALSNHAKNLTKLTLRAPLGKLDDLTLANFLLLAPKLKILVLEHRAELNEMCPLTQIGLERISLRQNCPEHFTLQGIAVNAPPQRISLEPISAVENPWSPRRESL